ncbi:MAG: LysR family transcriptional regulator [Actinobacteria bacterium]|nr:LysR family transcriptional regulator [Actinomycetota bacterium]
MLDTRRLQIFREVARCGSFAAAADALYLSHSAVSQQMAMLERTLGLRLFDRGARGVELTESGHVLLVHADAVLDRVADAEAELEAVAGRRGGRLRFGSFPTATLVFAARICENFRARYPEIDFQFVEGEPFQSLARIERRELDLALVFDLDRWPAGMSYDAVLVCGDEGIDYTELFDDPFFVVLPPSHRLASRSAVELGELEGELILGYGPWGSDLQHLARAEGFEPRFDPSYHSAEFNSFEAFVKLGRGVTLMPGLALTRERPGITARRLRPAPVRHVKIACRRGAHRSPAVEAMVEMIAAEVGSASFRSQLQRGSVPAD